MQASFQDLLKRLDQFSEGSRELKQGVHQAVKIAGEDPEMALTRARKVLEYVVRDVYERRCEEPPGTRPLENLLQRLVKDGHFPGRLEAYANTVRMLGNVGTHKFGEKITAADVYQSLTQLMPVLEWYFEVERSQAQGQNPCSPASPADSQPAVEPHAEPKPRLAIVPKGLRSFDAKDADFFLDLLPGPRDKDGLPESIRFWKHRIEDTQEASFTVGVIYGPSGCGKSSLVKAGLLPKLADSILSVYVEATAHDTESRLLRGLRRRCPELPNNLDLPAAIATLRHGKGIKDGQKVFIVLDQFEQWLHAGRGDENKELVQALRQCDGERVQCVVMVRDDFWLAVSRFMTDLHIELAQGRNIALVDLFDSHHAKNVLTAFGQAFGVLPTTLSKEQEGFLDHAVYDLAEDGRVISVRLALFAEMVKGKPWTLTTLKEVGGMEGVGISFLDGTFAASTAPPQHRVHLKAAQGVLKALLPEAWTDIKGHMRSQQELQAASGYSDRPQEFGELMRILDSEVRLITPTDLEGKERGDNEPCPTEPGRKYYQLTHDYLVPSVREWLIRKQKESRRGRTELRLAVWSSVWNAKPENRNLPSWWEWAGIRLLTTQKDWTPSQKRMMQRATRFHALRGAALAVLLTMATVTGLVVRYHVIEKQNRNHATELVQSLLNADTVQVPAIIEQMADYRKWVDPLLQDKNQESPENSRQKLHTSLALLPVDDSQVLYLYGRLLDADATEVPVIRDALAPHKDELVDKLWTVVKSPQRDKAPERLRAAAALAMYDPDSQQWSQIQEAVDNDLVAVPALHLAMWTASLRSVRVKLLPQLLAVYRDDRRRETERSLATDILADYAADDPKELANLLMDADENQFAVIYPKLSKQASEVLRLLAAEIDKKLPSDMPSSAPEREKLAKRQANAGVALIRLNHPEKVWQLLKLSSDPRVRSYLIHRLRPLGANVELVLKRLGDEQDISIRRGLILTLGEFEAAAVPDREALKSKLLKTYRETNDPGVHGAVAWLLRQWQEDGTLRDIDKQLQAEQEQRIKRIGSYLASRDVRAPGADPVKDARWYVNGQGQTMVVIPGPVEFLLGSPTTEEGRFGGSEDKRERQVTRQIVRTFAIAAKAVTVEEFQQFRPKHEYNRNCSNKPTCPTNQVTWYDAAAYCNWLSEKEGLTAVYEPNNDNEFGPGMKVKPNWLQLSGYRLPTESEWEYACRAGSTTSRYYGETEDLLGKYAWYSSNSLDKRMLPVGSLKPNDLGLFDMLGNVYQWCEDRENEYTNGEDKEAGEVIGGINNNIRRVMRGRSFMFRASNVRCADRFYDPPSNRYFTVGLRPARTFTP